MTSEAGERVDTGKAGAGSVLLLNQYYPPDTASTGRYAAVIASRFVAAGFDVTAVVGQPSYFSELPPAPRTETLDGVHVARVNLGGRLGRERIGVRIAGYLRYLSGAAGRSARVPCDLVLCFHNPPFLPVLATLLARWRRVPLIYVLYDIHPDVLIASGWSMPAPVVTLWDAVNRWVIRYATATVVLGDAMRWTLVTGKGADADRVKVIPLWSEPELEVREIDRAWRRAHGIDEELVFLVSGNMGVLQPLDQVLAAAELLRDLPIGFVLAGGGVNADRWRRQAIEQKLEHVHFLPFQAGDEAFARMVAAADSGLVCLRPDASRLALPSRTFSFLSAGRPVIALMDSDADVAQLVTSEGCGWAVTDAVALARLAVALLAERGELTRAGAKARVTYLRSHTPARVAEQYVALARAVLDSSRK